ncbi:stalk domain-containing protein [Lawsonibacter sp. LCP25S3_G6]|uniref:stalk domain-containing protein n=1 Tax=unclassified Lawsonibacter TaxID=2617946 RepID=UPI003F9D1CAF
MSSHIHELWDDLELQPLYPELNPDDIARRVSAALDQDNELPPAQAEPRKTPMKRSITSIVLFAAVLALMAGSVLAVAYRSGVLELFFPKGDTSQVEPYVQTALDTAENEDYRLRVDSCLYDGQNVYAVVTVEALNDHAAEDLMSNKIIAESHREMWGEDMVNRLLESGSTGPETFHCNFGDYYNEEESDVPMSVGGMGSKELPNPDDHSRSWQIDIQFGSYQGLQEQPLNFWVDFMGKDCAVDIPLDNMAEPIRLTPNEEVIYNPYTNSQGILKEFILTPTSFSVTVEPLEKPDSTYHTTLADQGEDCFFLRMKDGTILTRMQLGAFNDQFDTVVDLSQVQSIIYGYTEFPADGSPSFPADLPETLYPFTCTEIILEGTHFFRFPVEELCQKLGADYQWDEDTQTATAAYRGVTLTMTAGESCYKMNGETVELLFETRYDKTDPDYQAFPEYITLEDGVLTAPVTVLDHWSLNYIPLHTADNELAGQMLVIP